MSALQVRPPNSASKSRNSCCSFSVSGDVPSGQERPRQRSRSPTTGPPPTRLRRPRPCASCPRRSSAPARRRPGPAPRRSEAKRTTAWAQLRWPAPVSANPASAASFAGEIHRRPWLPPTSPAGARMRQSTPAPARAPAVPEEPSSRQRGAKVGRQRAGEGAHLPPVLRVREDQPRGVQELAAPAPRAASRAPYWTSPATG